VRTRTRIWLRVFEILLGTRSGIPDKPPVAPRVGSDGTLSLSEVFLIPRLFQRPIHKSVGAWCNRPSGQDSGCSVSQNDVFCLLVRVLVKI
jgi:hypothetical protein